MSQRILLPAAVVLLLAAGAGYFLWQPADSDEVVVSAGDAPARRREPAQNTSNTDAAADKTVDEADSEVVPPAQNLRKKLHEKTPHPTPKPLLEGWDVPAAALLLSGEMHGYIEPCGCSLNQMGGLSRRADLLKQMRDRGWPVTAFDVGGLVNNPARRQARLKLAMALKSLKVMNYGGVALGREELHVGVENLLTTTEDDRPAFLASNLLLLGAPDVVSQPYRVIAVGKLRIGVTAVFGESMKGPEIGRARAEGEVADVEVLDPVESLTKSLAALEAEKPDLLVLLSHAKRDESEKLAAKFPQFDIILSAGGPEDPDPQPKLLGKTLFVLSGQKGKSVGVVGVYPESKDGRLRFELVSLDGDRFRDAPEIKDQMREYQATLQVHNLVAGEPAIESPWNAQIKESNPFVGVKVCGECHKKAYEKWLSTGHAKATESIKRGRAGDDGRYKADFISRIYDPECVNCHVTGWSPDPKLVVRYKTGYESEQATPHLLGQQCENCHGPGGRHAELERKFVSDKSVESEVEKFRELAYIGLDQVAEKRCVKCHDGDNDPHFKTDGDVFEQYWEEIKHPWRN